MQRRLADYAEARKQSRRFIAVKGRFRGECKYDKADPRSENAKSYEKRERFISIKLSRFP